MRPLWPAIAPTIAFSCVLGCLAPPPPGSQSADPDAEGATSEAGAVVDPARSVAEIYEVGEVRGFEFTQLGTQIGHSWGRYEGVVEVGGRSVHEFSTKVELLPPGGKPLRWASQLHLDDAGLLVDGWERSVAAQLRFSVDLGAEVLNIEADAGLEKIEHQELNYRPEVAFMGYMSTLHEELMLAVRELVAGENEWQLVSLSAGREDLWSAKVEKTGKTVVLDTSLGEEIWLEGGRIVRIEVPEDELVVTTMAHPRWPEWEISGPARLSYTPPADRRFEIRPVELPGQKGEAALFGEVLIPKPEVHGPGPYPGVVFLGGSVSADRYGFAGPPAVDLGYHELTDALANAGFVVIRYDERGVGQSEDAPSSWAGQQLDAQRAFRTLLVQAEVDPDHILAVGHAEGGWRALKLAATRPKEIVAVALLASPGRSYRELFAAQPDILAALESGEGLPEKLEPMAQWYGEILVEDPEALIFKAHVPIWLAQGGNDFEVDPVADVAAWQGSARKYKRDLSLVRFPELDHHFKPSEEGANHTSYLEARPVDPAFLEALVGWAKGAVSK
ncbi:alpha/beta fold hydrolase [Pseudenhygromyxa sp. WMMC2535]|uniref:alpha/beta hydrolase family protein n=1 Tax=Pseudenhygromyxa sp. WMMC2535 TaxID=2712867 RepID=UPI0015545879|nr:alpha/beta fold hydrolase [Pseudenhygromyxa sp. WMMC2535]NVB37748.1 alpha/beta fold hydrolase [Pseudenhygromyxa sp. WMMC2535]